MAATVAELIEHLKKCDQSAVVMIECPDPYYTGEVDLDDIREGQAGVDVNYPLGKWTIVDDEGDRSITRECKPCVIIGNGL